MLNLEFQTPVFNEGEPNITVRRGTKWADKLLGDNVRSTMTLGTAKPVADTLVNIFDVRAQAVVGAALVESVTVVEFSALTDHDLRNHPREECQTVGGLFEVLSAVYPDFQGDELVTIITFLPTLGGAQTAADVVTQQANAAFVTSDAPAITPQTLFDIKAELAEEGLAENEVFNAESLRRAFTATAEEREVPEAPLGASNDAEIEAGRKIIESLFANREATMAKPLTAEQLRERARIIGHQGTHLFHLAQQHPKPEGEALRVEIVKQLQELSMAEIVVDIGSAIVAAIDRRNIAGSPAAIRNVFRTFVKSMYNESESAETLAQLAVKTERQLVELVTGTVPTSTGPIAGFAFDQVAEILNITPETKPEEFFARGRAHGLW